MPAHVEAWNSNLHKILLGLAVAQLVEALHYKSECRWFDSRSCQSNFSLTQSFRPHYGPGIDSVSNRIEYQEYFLMSKGGRCEGLTTLPALGVECFEIWASQPPGNLRACPGLSRPVMGLLYLCGPGSSVCIATGYRLDVPGIESRWRRDFPHLSSRSLWPMQPPLQWVPSLSRK